MYSPEPSSQTLRLSLGIFALVASIILMIMSVTVLKMDRARAKWRFKLLKAFESKSEWFRPSRILTSH